MLLQEYCPTCDISFSWKCMNKHSELQFDTLENRVSEERRKAPESLTAPELGEKPIRETKVLLSQTL